MEALVILVVLVSVAAAMGVLWLVLEVTGQSFGLLDLPPRSDKSFGLGLRTAPPPAPPPPSFPVSAVSPLAEAGRDSRLTVNSPAQASVAAPALPRADVPAAQLHAHPRRDLAVGAAARRTAFIVGSRAREAILGYGFANPDAATGGPPRAGEEPAPGHTVVLADDDVEAWVRERLYGGRLPAR